MHRVHEAFRVFRALRRPLRSGVERLEGQMFAVPAGRQRVERKNRIQMGSLDDGQTQNE